MFGVPAVTGWIGNLLARGHDIPPPLDDFDLDDIERPRIFIDSLSPTIDFIDRRGLSLLLISAGLAVILVWELRRDLSPIPRSVFNRLVADAEFQ